MYEECRNKCLTENKPCVSNNCQQWINYSKDLNCTLIAVKNNGAMTLEETGERLGISYVAVKRIEDKALKKLTRKLED